MNRRQVATHPKSNGPASVHADDEAGDSAIQLRLSHGHGRAPPAVLISIKETCRRYGLGRTLLWQLASDNEIEVIRIRRRTLVTVASMEALLVRNSNRGIA